jgi:hypothetical protein
MGIAPDGNAEAGTAPIDCQKHLQLFGFWFAL